jgi:hypothetical protein
MADQKISALTALTGANVDQVADVLAIVDTSVTTTKKILISELAQAMLVLGTEQASTSGTSIDFTGIPAWAKEITIMFVDLSTSGTSALLVQIGDSGGIEATGYKSAASEDTGGGGSSTVGFRLSVNQIAAASYSGKVVLSMEDSSDFTWVASGFLIRTDSTTISHSSAGNKATSAALTQVRITTVNGTDTFDAGAINILYR